MGLVVFAVFVVVMMAALFVAARRDPAPWGRRHQLVYGLALVSFGSAVFAAGFVTLDLIRAGQADLSGLLDGPADEYGWPRDLRGFTSEVTERITAAGVETPARRVSGLLIFLADLMAFVMIGFGWLLSWVSMSSEWDLQKLRLRLCLALTLLVPLLVAVQVFHAETINVLSIYNE